MRLCSPLLSCRGWEGVGRVFFAFAVIVKYRETFGLQTKKNLDVTKTRYNEHIFAVTWPFVNIKVPV